jgi:ribose 5-phosphate isomerase B
MKIAIACDHAGVTYKDSIKKLLAERGLEIVDMGTNDRASVDYPDFAHPVAKAVDNGEISSAILLCGTGNGVAMTANKYAKVRAGLCWTAEIASLIRQHNNANIVCIPARFTSEWQAVEIVKVFLDTAFEGGRHERRVNKMMC